MPTTAFDVKDAVKAALDADATLSAMANPICAITYGFDGRPDELPRLSVQVGEIVWDFERPITIGNRKRDEEYSIPLLIQSHVPGDTQKDANNRVKAVMQAMENIFRNERWSGVAGVWSSGIVPQQLAEGTDAEGRGAILLLRLYVTARI